MQVLYGPVTIRATKDLKALLRDLKKAVKSGEEATLILGENVYLIQIKEI